MAGAVQHAEAGQRDGGASPSAQCVSASAGTTGTAASPSGAAAPVTLLTDARAFPYAVANPSRRQWWMIVGLLLVLVAVGGWLRFRNLDALSMQVDEGFQALAVQGILEHGVPKLDTGLIYSRSPLFLYSQAAVAKVVGLGEWALRAPAAFFGVLSIPVAFLLGWRLLGPGAGIVLAVLMTGSAWELEYARYGRFYTLFQVLYMLGVVCFAEGFLRERRWAQVMFFVVFLLAVSTHDLGVMLGLCFWAVLPLQGYRFSRKAWYYALSAACGLIWVVYKKASSAVWLRFADVVPTMKNDGTADVVVAGDGVASKLLAKVAGALPGLKLPDFSLLDGVLRDGPVVFALLVLPALLGVAGLIAVKRREGPGYAARVPLLVLALGATAVHQFALAALLLLLYAAWHVRSWRCWLRPAEVVTLAGCALGGAAWVVYFWSQDDIVKGDWIPATTDFPAVYTYLLQWLVPGWKQLLPFMLLGGWVVARRAVAGTPRGNGAWLLLAALVGPIVVTSMLEWQFSESRYFFHLYPLMLLLVSALLVTAGTWVAGCLGAAEANGTPGRRWVVSVVCVAVLTAGVMLASKDLRPGFAFGVTQRDHLSAKDPIRSVLNFPFYAFWSQDQRTASLQAAPLIQPGDRVLVVGPVHIAANYRWFLPRVDYIASTQSQYITSRQTEDGRWIDLVSGGDVIGSVERLRDVLHGLDGDLWVFSDTAMTADRNWYLSDADPLLKEAIRQLSAEPVWIGADGKSTVSRVSDPAAVLDRLAPVTPDGG